MDRFIAEMPKAELHLHIEGTFEPELMFKIAARNGIKMKYISVDELKSAYLFTNLQEFLDIYYQGAQMLITEQDFYDLTFAYLEKAYSQKIIHTEIFFDPQTHTSRGIPFSTVINGISLALEDAHKKWGITSQLILCFLRHLDAESAMATLEEAIQYKDKIIGVGLDSSEIGNPPEKFTKVFENALQQGFLTVAHAGEEGPADYIRGALNYLHISRIDHGNRVLDDEELLKELAQKKVPFTICPLSNLKLCVVKNLEQHPLKNLMQAGLLVTVNSDDPAYFGGYINENYIAIQKALSLSKDEIITLASNSFKASFVTDEYKTRMLEELDSYIKQYPNEVL